MLESLRSFSNCRAILLANRAVSIAFPIVVIAALVNAAAKVGPWFDEFWSLYFSDPTISLHEALFARWALDVHPPLFAFISWLAASARWPHSVLGGRMLNFLPLLLFAAYCAGYWRFNREDRPFLVVFLAGFAALAQFIDAFSEFRSYFLATLAYAALVISLKRLDRAPEDPPGAANGRLLWTGQIVSLFICLNVHFVSALLAVALVGTFAFSSLLRGNRRAFFVHLATGSLCSIPLVATTAFQWPYLTMISQDYWLKTKPFDALVMLARAVVDPIVQTLAMNIAWLGAACLRVLSRQRFTTDDRFALTLLASLLPCAAVIYIYTVATGALTTRYLVPVTLTSIGMLAAGTARAVWSQRLARLLFLIACLAAIIEVTLSTAARPNWNEAARFVAGKQHACPGARVVVLRANIKDQTANVSDTYSLGYGALASRFGIRIEGLDKMPTETRDLTCPDLYWADNQFGAGKSRQAMVDELRERFPPLAGCAVEVHVMQSQAAVFEVSGNPPQCAR